MSLFSKILSKLGFGDNKAEASTSVPATPAPATPKPAAGPVTTTAAPAAGPAPVRPQMNQVDVASKLEQLASANSEKLNWKVSIVDLMKLLDMDSSLASQRPCDRAGLSPRSNR